MQIQDITQKEKDFTFKLKATNVSPEIKQPNKHCNEIGTKRISPLIPNQDVYTCNDLCLNEITCKEFALTSVGRCDLYNADDCTYYSETTIDVYKPTSSINKKTFTPEIKVKIINCEYQESQMKQEWKGNEIQVEHI